MAPRSACRVGWGLDVHARPRSYTVTLQLVNVPEGFGRKSALRSHLHYPVGSYTIAIETHARETLQRRRSSSVRRRQCGY
eukprot:scaffold145823_cov24-Tisochrysis_lutea.AAC.1